MYTYICLKCTQFQKINAGNSLSECGVPQSTYSFMSKVTASPNSIVTVIVNSDEYQQ